MTGNFIVIGGIDGCGGTTHCKLLYEWIKEHYQFEVILTKEPTDGKIGLLIREYLKSGQINKRTDALLFAADRSEHIHKTIRPALERGACVICDRYIESSLAYQCAQGLDLDWILKINESYITPDLIIILDIDPKTALLRKSKLEDKFEKIGFLKSVRKLYHEHTKAFGYKMINSDRPIEEVQTDIREEVKKLLKNL
ncbi:MAG: dTMP kinase [Candidatus Helarchaeota archaeon]